jgi:hypothetical protein
MPVTAGPRGRHLRRRSALPARVLALLGVAVLAVSATTRHSPHEPPLSTAASATPSFARVFLPSAVAPALAASPATHLRQPTPLRPSIPVILEVPGIGVRSTLLRLGQGADGSLAVPPPGPTYDQAGWYRYSPTPGSLGPAVIVGHVDSRRGGPSVFYRLGELRRGDTIRVTRADGSVAVFAVEQVRRFTKSDFPTRLVYGNTDHAALRLVTCGGPFDRNTGHYRDNIVVLASLRSVA